jgi:aspartyl-tRNA(Asn)/glutamyl-tRNA(Gln) amidotransferase subunit C
MDEGTVKRAADVARIRLGEDELRDIKGDIDGLSDILNALKDAPECDDLCFIPIDIFDALRDDVPAVYDNVEEILKGLCTYNGYVRGPKIV